MLPTPATPSLPTSVYPPSEDSYLLLDVLSSPSEVSFLRSRFSPGTHTNTSTSISTSNTSTSTTAIYTSPSPLMTDLGTGSGLILAFLTAHATQILGRSDVVSLGLDLSRDACATARRTVALACRDEQREQEQQREPQPGPGTGTFLDTVQSDLTSALRPHCVDLLVFNPPYVPTDEVPRVPGDCFDYGDEAQGAGHGHGHGHGPEGKGMSEERGREWEDGFARDSRLLDVAVAGGVDGMVVTGRLLFGDSFGGGAGASGATNASAREGTEDGDSEAGAGTASGQGLARQKSTANTGLDSILSKDRGVAYVLLSVRNRPKDVIARLRAEMDDEDDDGGRVGDVVDNILVDDNQTDERGEVEQQQTTAAGGETQRRGRKKRPRWSSVEIAGATGRKGGIESLVVVRIAR